MRTISLSLYRINSYLRSNCIKNEMNKWKTSIRLHENLSRDQQSLRVYYTIVKSIKLNTSFLNNLKKQRILILNSNFSNNNIPYNQAKFVKHFKYF